MSLLPSEFGTKTLFVKTDVACFSDNTDYWKRSTMEEFADRLFSGNIQSVGAPTVLGGALTVPLTTDLVGVVTKRGATKDLKIMDSGTVTATEFGWVEVTVGGATGYIRVYAAK